MASRKLLVLDLNGTLLLRSKYARSAARSSNGPRPRSVYPRPYLPAFREYIFSSDTMQWLDIMVWSSAQPASVADMVHHSFGEQQRKLIAIWARDTLGLPPELYYKKTATTKDLATTWATFPAHDARTTVLLDDSARKAHRHPHNHVCVREYSADARRRDLAVWRAADMAVGKSKALQAPNSGAPPPATADAPPPWVLASQTYDETLLAVVGILDALKTQTDVAGWIRSGGLLGVNTGDEQAAHPSDRKSRPPSPLTDADALQPDLRHQLAALSLSSAPDPAAAAWFDSEAVVRYWVGQGRLALAALQIDAVAGIHSDAPEQKPGTRTEK